MSKKQKQELTLTGQLIEQLCKQRGLSWEELGRRAGINPSLISRALQGKTKPKPETIERICRALDITDEDLVDAIYNSLGHPSPRQIAHAEEVLSSLLKQKGK